MKRYSDIATDGGSKIVEQVLEQRLKIEKNLSSIKHLVAIGSGKGGVGKSTLTMQIAFALRGEGFRVSVLDADFNGHSLSRLFGIQNAFLVPGKKGLVVPKTKEGVGVVSMGLAVPESEIVEFESVSHGESYVWRATKEFSVLGELLASAEWGELDLLLIDLPPGVERTFQFAEFFGKLTKFVLVTIPSQLSVGVVNRSVKSLQKAKSPILGYIENMSGYFCLDCKKVQPLFRSSDSSKLGIPCLGAIPFDPELAELCDRGVSLMEKSDLPSASAVLSVARNICNIIEGGGGG